MSEEQDSRTATIGKKRTFENTLVYDLVTESDSSDGEPAYKRTKQTSHATQKLPSVSVEEVRRLHITNLAYAATEEEVKSFFNGFSVESVSIPLNYRTGRPTGYAFVVVSTPGEAERAVTELSDKEFLGRKVSIQLALKSGESKRAERAFTKLPGKEIRDRKVSVKPEASPAREASQIRHVISLLDSNDEDLENPSAESGEVSEDPVTVPAGFASNGSMTRVNHSQDNEIDDDLSSVLSSVPSLAVSIQKDLPTVQGSAYPAAGRQPSAGRLDIEPSQNGMGTNKILEAIAQGRRINIGRLRADITSEKVLALFKDFQVESVQLPLNFSSKKSVGFGYICLLSYAEATRAINTLNGKEIDGRVISLKLSNKLGSTMGSGDKNNVEIATKGNQDVKQLGRDVGRPDQLPARTYSDKDIEAMCALTSLSRDAKELIRYWKIWGDEYINAVEEAIAQKSEHAIPVPSKRRLYHAAGHPNIRLPEMVTNGSLISFSELTYEKFIPLLMSANPSLVHTLVQKKQFVYDGFMVCVNGLYQQIDKRRRREFLRPLNDLKPTSAYSLIARGTASVMPDVLRKVVEKLGPGKHQNVIKNAITEALGGYSGQEIVAQQLESGESSAAYTNQKSARANDKLSTDIGLYSPQTIQMYAENARMFQPIERMIRLFAANSNEDRLRFPPKHPKQRKFIHSLAQDFGLQAESVDPGTDRYVVLLKTRSFVFAPKEILGTVVDMNTGVKSDLCMETKEASNLEVRQDPLKILHAKDQGESTSAQISSPIDRLEQLHASRPVAEGENEAHMKYFPSSTLSTSLPRCLNCGQTEHHKCGPIACMSCGENETHFTWACPKVVRCQKCREQGHQTYDCPEKLSRSGSERTTCDHCGSSDHVETACSDLWRTYRSLDTVKKVRDMRIQCFSCGSESHFGVDCGLQPRNRRWQSLSFSMHAAQQYIDPNSNDRSLSAGKDFSIKGSSKKKDFSIKGRAKNEPINLDSDSDGEDFLRPPVKKMNHDSGNIQINNRNTQGYSNPAPPPMSRTFSRDPMPSPHQYRAERGSMLPERVAPPSQPAYRNYHEEKRTYGRSDERGSRDEYNTHRPSDHYQPQRRSYDGAADDYDVIPSNPAAAPTRGGGGPRGRGGLSRGGGFSRGGGATRGGKNASRGGKAPGNGPKRPRKNKKQTKVSQQ